MAHALDHLANSLDHQRRLLQVDVVTRLGGDHVAGVRHQGRQLYAFTRGGDLAAQDFARALGAVWAGGSDERPPEELDAAIIFAPVGALIPVALRAVREGGVVVGAQGPQ